MLAALATKHSTGVFRFALVPGGVRFSFLQYENGQGRSPGRFRIDGDEENRTPVRKYFRTYFSERI